MASTFDLSVTIAGAGNVGSFLALELFKSGCTIKQVYSRTEKHAAELAAQVNSVAITDPKKIDLKTGLIILALPDKVIVDFCKRIADVCAGGTGGQNPVIASTAGSVALAELSGIYPDAGVLYPLQTFTRYTNPEPSVIPFCIEGSNFRVEQLLGSTAKRITNDVRFITSGQRLIIHLAAVFACNFTNHMIALSDRIIEKANLDLSILMPLINETFSRLRDNKPFDVQTGPAVRNDLNTISKHTDLLEGIDEIALKALYTIISDNIALMHNNKE